MELIFFIGFLIFYFAIIGIWFLSGYVLIRLFASKENVNQYFSLFFTGTVVALAVFWLCELGYQMNFWKAPGIWGAPGKEDTGWFWMQIVLVPLGFAAGRYLDRIMERKYREGTWFVRIELAILVVILIIATINIMSYNDIQTMG